MKQIIITICLLLCGLLFLGSNCEPLSFEPTSFYGTVKVSETFNITGDEPNYSKSMTFDFAAELSEIGIDYNDIESVTVQNIELIFTNNGGPDPIIFNSLEAAFTESGGTHAVVQISGPYSNTFSAINGLVFNPYEDDAMLVLGTVPSGITELTNYLSVMPPRSFTGTVQLNNVNVVTRTPEANFFIEMSFYVQVQYNP